MNRRMKNRIDCEREIQQKDIFIVSVIGKKLSPDQF